jgi:hypothetical protein
VVTFGALCGTNADADHKVLVRFATLKNVGESIVSHDLFNLFPVDDVVRASFPCQITLKDNLPQLNHRESQEF